MKQTFLGLSFSVNDDTSSTHWFFAGRKIFSREECEEDVSKSVKPVAHLHRPMLCRVAVMVMVRSFRMAMRESSSLTSVLVVKQNSDFRVALSSLSS